MSSLRRGVQNSDNISRGRDTNNQTGEMFRTFQDIVNPQVANRAENVVNSVKNSSILGPVIQGYEKIEPYIPKKLDEETQGEFYGYEAPMGPGILTFGTDRDFDNFYGGYQFNFNDGGIATLAGDLEQKMTPLDPQQINPKKLTDEQKDYLYDYMLDFMFKQKQREQMENEGRIPPFNYEGLEV
tara:strand:- start:283 stop:834 length:552 start_codon:yes stop_codon:yes gene_type:complete